MRGSVKFEARPLSYSFSSDADSAGLDVTNDGRGCNESAGTLTIREITFNVLGNVAALNATFVQYCDADTAALRGKIHYYA